MISSVVPMVWVAVPIEGVKRVGTKISASVPSMILRAHIQLVRYISDTGDL